jgi:hypothetical protein
MKKIKVCQKCGKEYSVYPYEFAERKFCSMKCANVFNAPKLSKARIGKNNPMYNKKPWNWMGGNTQNRKYNMKYWIWRRDVFKRDNYICQECGVKLKRKDCVAHHIKPWRDYKELRFNVDNGVTYCRSCHNKIDDWIKKNQYKLKEFNYV